MKLREHLNEFHKTRNYPGRYLPEIYTSHYRYGMCKHSNIGILYTNPENMTFIFPFTNKEQYLEWRKEWKVIYKGITHLIRLDRVYRKECLRKNNFSGYCTREDFKEKIYNEHPKLIKYDILEHYSLNWKVMRRTARVMNYYLKAAQTYSKVLAARENAIQELSRLGQEYDNS